MVEAVRLVIWDLDETFWCGTLTEGGIREYVQEHHDIVIELSKRGIMNSICSKNDRSTVEKILRDKGLWDYFIFPSIDWSPKGTRIARIVEMAQLRPPTVLFIDDNHGNRAEAAAAVPGIQVADETHIRDMLRSPAYKGKDDSSLSRLSQYKLLEQKNEVKSEFGDDNTAFLRKSDIRVTIESDLDDKLDRVVELINRTNQLNFTKKRLPEDLETAKQQIKQSLNNHDVRAGLVSVKDKFGDYGYCGFFLVSGIWGTSRLWHFAFSCRTLGMGVEQWVYDILGRPKLEIVGEVLSDFSFVPDWINVEGLDGPDSGKVREAAEVRIRGGCELEVLQHFFRASYSHVESEVVSVHGLHSVQRNNSAMLLQGSRELSNSQKDSLAKLRLSVRDVKSEFLRPCPDQSLLIFSPTGDAFARIYQNIENDLLVSVFLVDFGAPAKRSDNDVDAFFKRKNLNSDDIKTFFEIKSELENSYTCADPDDTAFLGKIYRDIVDILPKNALTVIVLPNHRMVKEGQLVENGRLVKLNDEFVAAGHGAEHIRFISVSNMVDPLKDVQDHFFHFNRDVYLRLFNEIDTVYREWKTARN